MMMYTKVANVSERRAGAKNRRGVYASKTRVSRYTHHRIRIHTRVHIFKQ